MKAKRGASILESFQEYAEYVRQAAEQEENYREADDRESRNLEELSRRREEEEEEGTPNPAEQTERLKGGSILHLILKDPGSVSGKRAELAGVPSDRTLLTGSGARGKNAYGVLNDAWFLAYLLEHFGNAAACLTGEKEGGPWLDYQLEYLIAGRDSDIANPGSGMWKVIGYREGMNYAYLLTDSAKVAECTTMATLLVGATLIPGLVEAVKQMRFWRGLLRKVFWI